MRNMTAHGLVDAPGRLRHFDKAPMIAEQHRQLSALLAEYDMERRKIESDPALSSAGKLAKLEPLTQAFQKRLERMEASLQFLVHGAEDMKRILTVAKPTTGDATVDFLRSKEIRDRLISMDSSEQMEALLSNNPEILHSIVDAPLPFAYGFKAEAEKALIRLGEQANPEAAAKLSDYQEISATIESNFQAARQALTIPQVSQIQAA